MAGRWRVPIGEGDYRDVSFDELALGIANGVFRPQDPITDLFTGESLSVDEIIGLRQSVARILAGRQIPEPAVQPVHGRTPTTTVAPSNPATEDSPPADSTRTGRLRTVIIPAAISAIIAAGLLIEQFRRWKRFPIHPDNLAALRPWWFPLLGPVTAVEFVFLLLDISVLIFLIAITLRRKA